MARPPKKAPKEILNTKLPELGQWFINNLEITHKIDHDGKLAKCLGIVYAPVEMIQPHGNSSMVYFDQNKLRLAQAFFTGDMTMTAKEFVKRLRTMADEVERLAK